MHHTPYIQLDFSSNILNLFRGTKNDSLCIGKVSFPSSSSFFFFFLCKTVRTVRFGSHHWTEPWTVWLIPNRTLNRTVLKNNRNYGSIRSGSRSGRFFWTPLVGISWTVYLVNGLCFETSVFSYFRSSLKNEFNIVN